MEHWISQLLSTTQSTLHEKVLSALKPQQEGSTFSLEECAHSNVTQVASMALYFQWTKDCEHALTQCRYIIVYHCHLILALFVCLVDCAPPTLQSSKYSCTVYHCLFSDITYTIYQLGFPYLVDVMSFYLSSHTMMIVL